jgi:hypothetical protein
MLAGLVGGAEKGNARVEPIFRLFVLPDEPNDLVGAAGRFHKRRASL